MRNPFKHEKCINKEIYFFLSIRKWQMNRMLQSGTQTQRWKFIHLTEARNWIKSLWMTELWILRWIKRNKDMNKKKWMWLSCYEWTLSLRIVLVLFAMTSQIHSFWYLSLSHFWPWTAYQIMIIATFITIYLLSTNVWNTIRWPVR